MLDNGYLYLAASRLSLFLSERDWAMVIEVFGFSPRTGAPDIHVHTFANTLNERNPPERYVSKEAYDRYLASNPNNESRFFFPIANDSWQDEENCELVAKGASDVSLRSQSIVLPSAQMYVEHGINLEDTSQVKVFEACRFLAATQRDLVLATPAERRVSVLPEMKPLLQLEEWRHPNLLADERPSDMASFRQLARVLECGDPQAYQPTEEPNTHWRNWPDGGTL
jgi:uncharacterized protein DUF7003